MALKGQKMKYLNIRGKKSDSLYLIYFLQIKLAIDIASQRYPLIKKMNFIPNSS